jgi:hypothetical protein
MSNRKERAGRSRLVLGVPLAAGLLAATTLPTWAAPASTPVTHVSCSAADLVSKVATFGSMASAQILSLPAGCQYVLTGVADSTYGNSGTAPITGTLAIRGNGASISRAATASSNFRIFTVAGQLSIDRATISGGLADCSGGPCPANSAVGGAIGVFGGNLDVTRSTLRHNSATCGTNAACVTGSGGAIGAVPGIPSPGAAVVVITDSTLADNDATCLDTFAGSSCTLAAGGAVDAAQSDLHVLRSTFHGNKVSCTGGSSTCSDADGGALAAYRTPDDVTIADSTFDHNSAVSDQTSSGGAISLIDVAATLSDNQIHDNAATSTGTVYPGVAIGGGVYFDTDAIGGYSVATALPVSVSGGAVQRNKATGGYGAVGGGITASNFGWNNLDLVNVQVTGNSATGGSGSGYAEGGGVASYGPTRASHTAIDRNSARGASAYGGGLSTSSALDLEQGTVSENTATGFGYGEGGGLDFEGAGSASLVDEHIQANVLKDPNDAVGGGVYTDGPMVVHGGTVRSNRVIATTAAGTASGGGLYEDSGSGVTLAVLGGAVVGDNAARNTATPANATGGGIYNNGAAGSAEVDPPSQVVDNTPDQCAPAGSVTGC